MFKFNLIVIFSNIITHLSIAVTMHVISSPLSTTAFPLPNRQFLIISDDQQWLTPTLNLRDAVQRCCRYKRAWTTSHEAEKADLRVSFRYIERNGRAYVRPKCYFCQLSYALRRSFGTLFLGLRLGGCRNLASCTRMQSASDLRHCGLTWFWSSSQAHGGP